MTLLFLIVTLLARRFHKMSQSAQDHKLLCLRPSTGSITIGVGAPATYSIGGARALIQ